MGYTHYWNITEEFPVTLWRGFANDFIKILPHFIDKLDHETNQKFNVNGENMIFNGIGEEAHETFTMNRTNPLEKSHTGEIEYFDFCKTARKEYDIAVCCALIIAKKYFGNRIKVSSDGEEEWEESKELCQKVLKYGKTFNMSYENKNGGEFK